MVGAASYSAGLLASSPLQPDDTWRSYYLDRCGKLLWSLPNSNGSWMLWFVGFDETLLVGGGAHAQAAYLYSSTGERLLGPVPWAGFPTTIGGDGTIYNTTCITWDQWETPLGVIAYSPQLTDRWILDLGKPCTYSGTTLADDGVLYVARDLGGEGGIEVIAIQTASPGVAPTGFATRQYNNRRTGWLSP